MHLGIDTEEKIMLLAGLGSLISKRIELIRKWDRHEKNPYSIKKISYNIKKARKEINLFRKLSGESYMLYLDAFVMS